MGIDWNREWALFMSAPIEFIGLAVAMLIVGFWFGRIIAKSEISGLKAHIGAFEQRLLLANEIKEQLFQNLESTKLKVVELNQKILAHEPSGSLVEASSSVASNLKQVATTAGRLQTTLGPFPHTVLITEKSG